MSPGTDAFQVCYAFTSRPDIEGGIANDRHDPGGLTNTGLTLADLRHFSRSATASDLLTLTNAEKQAIYLALYFLPIAGWDLPPAIALMVFDHGVLCGVGDSAKILQRLLGFTGDNVDGQIGPDTLAAVAATTNLPKLVQALADAQDIDLRGKSDAARYLDGWENRLAARTADAQTLLGRTTTCTST